MHNKAVALELEVDLDGMAVAYPEEVDRLVRADGSFRTDLSLEEMASALRISRRTIAKPARAKELDPEAVLFTVVTGRVTEESKAQSRRMRAIEVRERRGKFVGSYEWVTAEVPFSRSALEHPSNDQRAILEAISHSARVVPRQPGGKINAVAVSSAPEGGRPGLFGFAGGFLPLEPLPDAHAEGCMKSCSADR
jgi:hypothetical protein